MAAVCVLCLVSVESTREKRDRRKLHGPCCARENRFLSRAVACTGSLTPFRLAQFRNPNAYLCGACKDLLFKAVGVSFLYSLNLCLCQSIVE